MDYLFFWIFEALIGPLLVLGFFFYLVVRIFQGRSSNKDSVHALFFSREDGVGQVYALFAFAFLWLALSGLNRQLSEPLAYYSISGIVSILALVFAYYKKVIILLPLALLNLGGWWLWKATEWTEAATGDIRPAALFAVISLFALILYSLSFVHKKKFHFMRAYMVYTVLGLIGGTGILFFLSTSSGIEALQWMTQGLPPFGSWQIMTSLLIGFLAFVSILVYSVQEKYLSLSRAGFIGGLGIVPIVFLGLPPQTLITPGADYYGSQSIFSLFTQAGVAWFFLLNILLFAEVVALILSGYAEKETWRVNLGTFFLFLFIGVKYFDFYSLLDKSVFFIGAGLILCGMGFFMEKGRKKMVSDITAASN